MPILQPLPIQTAGKSWYVRAWRWFAGRRRWRLMEDWFYPSKAGVVFVVPAGFIFDGASVPRFLWWILSPVGLLLIPSILHDHAYRYGFLWVLGPTDYRKFGRVCDRYEWDLLFKQVSHKVNGVHVATWAAWLGVRIGGWAAWNKNRRENHTPIEMRIKIKWNG